MNDRRVAGLSRDLYDKVKALTTEVEVLNLAALEADAKAELMDNLARSVAQDVMNDCHSIETLVLLSYVAAKASHVAARSKNNIDWVMLAEKADNAAKDAYDFAVKVTKSNLEKQPICEPSIPIENTSEKK